MDGKDIEVAKYGSIRGKEEETVAKTAETKSSTAQWIKLATLAFGNFGSAACMSLQSPFFPAEAERKGSSPTEYGFIFGIFNITVVFAAPVFGMLVAYIYPKYILNFGAITVGTSCILFGALDLVDDSTTFVALAFTLRILEGIGSAALRTSSQTIVAVEFPEGLGKMYALLQTCSGVGIIIGPTLGGALYDVGGFGLPFFILGSGVLVDAIILFFVFPKVETPKNQEKVSVMKLLLHPTSFIYIFSVFTSLNYIGFNSATLEPHLREFHLSGSVLGLVFSLVGVLYAISATAFGWIADKKFCNNEIMCLVGSLLIVASLFLIGPAPFLPLTLDLSYIFIAQTLIGIGMGAKKVSAFTGMVNSASNRGFPAEFSTYGLVTSMLTSSQSLGAFVGPSLGGYLLENVGYRNASMFQLFMEIILVILLIILIIRSKFCGNTAEVSLEDELKILPKTSQIISIQYIKNGNMKINESRN